MSSVERNDHSDGATTTLTVGSLFAFAIMGAFPVVVTAWVIRKLMNQRQVTQTRQIQQKQSPRMHRSITRHSNHLVDDHDTPTSSIRSCILNSEGLQPSINISNTDPNIKSATTSNISSVTPVLPTSDPSPSTPRVREDDDDLLTDGDDTITARLYENCVRLFPYHLKSPILPTTTTTTTSQISMLKLDAAQTKARAQEYRRACRPQRVYLDEIVPSDVELGLSKSRRKSKCTTTTTTTSTIIDDNDELSYPSQRDPGIIQRYFGISFQNQTSTMTNPPPGMDDPSHSHSRSSSCPNHASISSRSSSSSSGCSDQDSIDDDDYDDGYYDATLYHQDFRQLGDLVDL